MSFVIAKSSQRHENIFKFSMQIHFDAILNSESTHEQKTTSISKWKQSAEKFHWAVVVKLSLFDVLWNMLNWCSMKSITHWQYMTKQSSMK